MDKKIPAATLRGLVSFSSTKLLQPKMSMLCTIHKIIACFAVGQLSCMASTISHTMKITFQSDSL